MPCEAEAMLLSLLLLEFLYGRIKEFNLFAAQFTYQVIMVPMSVPRFIACHAIPEMDLSGKASIGKELYGAINGGLSYSRATVSYAVIQLFRRDVTVTLEQSLQDQRSLGRHFQVFLCKVLSQYLERGYDQPPLILRTVINGLYNTSDSTCQRVLP
jgi:hypothetical protein